MANQEQVDLIKQGVDVWNAWRGQHPDIRPDLTRADLPFAGLSSADLAEANLSQANLTRANLTRANLARTIFAEANLFKANFAGASLAGAILPKASLTEANLFKANLAGASLAEAILIRVNLAGASLTNADLTEANLSQANLFQTNFTGAKLAYTILAWVDLCNVNGLETVVHMGPSSVDVKTVTLPEGDTRVHFLRGVGFPDTFIDHLPSLLTMPLQYHSLFLSHSHLDHLFTKKLHDGLQNKGVRCWLASHDLRPGTPIVRGIDEAIHLHDKLLLVLSEHAMRSHWVQTEVESALYRETTTGQEILFPIRLDNAVLESETLWAQRLRTRHIGDFTNWQDETTYQQAFSTLLHHLKVVKPSPR